MFKMIGLTVSGGLIAAACFLSTTPWRVHGGRFVTEYLLLAGAIGVVGLIGLLLSLRYGG